MLINGHFDYSWFTNNLKYNDWEYNALTLIDKLNTFKEYMGIFQQDEFSAISNM